jgi:hypothetical protein
MPGPDPFVLDLILVAVLIVGLLAALLAVFVSRRRPELTIPQVLERVVLWLLLATMALMALGCALVLHSGCAPENRVCDAPMMAAAGVTSLGALVAALVVVVGVPAASVVLKLTQRR